MGQYYKVVNVDKKEMLEPFDYGNGMKLMEWSYDRNPMVLTLMNLLADYWAGDRVFVIGDYADDADIDEPCHSAVVKLMAELGTDNLYGWADTHCARIVPRDDDPAIDRHFKFEDSSATLDGLYADTKDHGLRFIVNRLTQEYIDLQKCPVEWTWENPEGVKFDTKIAPISLLLAMGNDRGGGDFHEGNSGYEYVGSWCDTVKGVEVHTDLPEDAAEYEEFEPVFTERRHIDQKSGVADLRPDILL